MRPSPSGKTNIGRDDRNKSTGRYASESMRWLEHVGTQRGPLDVASFGHITTALLRIEAHHDWLREQGEPLAARGARAEWLDGAILLGATPADRHGQASTKVDFLRRSLESAMACHAIFDGQENAVAMVVAAATSEAERWCLPAIDLVTSSHGWDDAGERPAAIAPTFEELGRYESTGERATMAQAGRRVELVERDLRKHQRSGDQKAIAGALFGLHLNVLRAVATSVRSLRDLEAKQAMLCRHSDVCEPAWLLDPMIGAPLLLDYWKLDLSPSEQERLRQQLPRLDTDD